MAYEWHSLKAASNLTKHGISFEEAQTVFDDPQQYHEPDYAHSLDEARFLCIGMSDRFRLLIVSYTERRNNIMRIISARPVTKAERQLYESQSDLT